jgi:hypothetical protein
MPLVGGLLVAAAAAGLALAARLRVAFVALLAVVFIVPSTLVAPNGISSFVTTNRVVLGAFLLGMVVRWRRGEVPRDVFRVTRVHVTVAALALTALVVGVGLAPAGTPSLVSIHNWAGYADGAAFFIAAVAAIRAIGDPRWVARAITTVVLISAVIGIVEHYTGGSWARWWFHSQRSQLGSLPAVPLEHRLGSVRVRAAEPFALAFGWACAVLVPLVVAVVGGWRGRRALLGIAPVGAVVLAMYWSLSRSAFAGLAVGALLLLVGARGDRRVVPYVAAGAVAAVVVAMAAPQVYQSLFHLVPEGSVQVRSERLHLALGAAASRPYLGVGLGGLSSYDVPTTDSSYLLTYSSLGVVGLVVMVVTLVTAVATAAGALRAEATSARVIGAGALAGAVAALVGAGAYDLFSEATSQEIFWLLVALCVAISEDARAARTALAETTTDPAEPSPVPAAVRTVRALLPRLAARGALIGAFALAGVGVGHLGSPHAAVEYDFSSIPAAELSPALNNQVYLGEVLRNSACSVVTAAARLPAVSVYCEQETAPGFAYVRVQAPTPAQAAAAARQGALAALRNLPGFSPQILGPVSVGRPTWARTAPAAGALLGLGLAVLLPLPRRLRMRVPAGMGVRLRRLAPA